MLSVFAALAEFVVVKVLDVQYQYQVNRIPKVVVSSSKFIEIPRVCYVYFMCTNTLFKIPIFQ